MSAALIPVLTPLSEITDASLGALHDLLEPHFDTEAPGLVLDLGAVQFINSAGLGALVKIGMRLDGGGRRLALARPNKTIERMLRLIGLESKLPIFRSVEEASRFISGLAAQGGR